MADTLTTHLLLTKPAPDISDPDTDWATKLNADLDLIDATFDLTIPTTQNFGDSADPGSSLKVARADHKHGMPTLQNVYQNLLINGGFEFWQRATSFSSPANNAWTADRWQSKKAGGTPPTFTVAQESGAGNVDRGTYSLKLNCTNAGATLSDGLYISQPIEDYKNYLGKTVTFTVRVKTTATTVKARIKDSVSSNSSAAHTGDGTYRTLTVTRTVDAAATSLALEVGMLATTDVVITAVYIDCAMLVIGSTASEFIALTPQEDLARCQRWYEIIGSAANPILFYGLGGNDSVHYDIELDYIYKVQKASATVTFTVNALKVYEEGDATDHSGSYIVTNIGAIDHMTLEVSKAIGGNKPNGMSFWATIEV